MARAGSRRPDADAAPLHRSAFPPDFLFGVATSAYQIEGHGQGGAGITHWDTFAATPGNVARQETGARACDHYHRWGEDLDLAAALGAPIYRFSTSWARLIPDGRGRPNPKGLDFYDRLIDGMLTRGLKPAATLYHWELPAALADRGGWANRDTALAFGDLARLVGQRFGDRLWSIAPINEPWCVAWLSHFEGLHAPGLRDIRATARAMHHVLLAHGLGLQALRSEGCRNLGALCNFEPAYPASPHPADQKAAARRNAIYNQFFLSGLFHGRYPELALEGLGPHLPERWEADFATIQTPLDWLGVNYYTCSRVAWTDGAWPNIAQHPAAGATSMLGWETHPAGLGNILDQISLDFCPELPLYITENGWADHSAPGPEGQIADPGRIAYLRAHLAELRQALAKGQKIKGYVIWSLLDNFEWAHGYEPRFGLVHVDFETLARRPKSSYHALKAFLREGAPL